MSEENNTPEFLQPDADEVEVPSLPRCPRERGRKNGKKTRGNSAGSSRSRSSVRGRNGGNKDRGQNRGNRNHGNKDRGQNGGNKDGDRNGRKGGSTGGTNDSSKRKRTPGSGDTPTGKADCNRSGVGGRQSDAWQTADEAFSPSSDEQPPGETNDSARKSADSPDSNVNAPPNNNAKGKKPTGGTNDSARKSADSPDSNVNAPPKGKKPRYRNQFLVLCRLANLKPPTEMEVGEIFDGIFDRIDQMITTKLMTPRFSWTNFDQGRYLLACCGNFTFEWVKKAFNDDQLFSGFQVLTTQEHKRLSGAGKQVTQCYNLTIPSIMAKIPKSKITSFIRRQNELTGVLELVGVREAGEDGSKLFTYRPDDEMRASFAKLPKLEFECDDKPRLVILTHSIVISKTWIPNQFLPKEKTTNQNKDNMDVDGNNP